MLHLRKLATMELLGQLFGVTSMTISRASQEVRPPSGRTRPSLTASTARFRTPADVTAFLTPETTQNKIQQAC